MNNANPQQQTPPSKRSGSDLDLQERKPDEIENPGDPGPNILVPPSKGDPRTEGLPSVPKPSPGV